MLHAIHWIKRELSICQSLLYHILRSFHVLSQVRSQAPLLEKFIRPYLIFMFNVLSALPGLRSSLSQEILCIVKLMTANYSVESPPQHIRRIYWMTYISNTCNVPVTLDMHVTREGGLTEQTHIGRSHRQSARLISKTSTTKQEMQTSGKILRFTRRSLTTDVVSELARSILHSALWWHKTNRNALMMACKYLQCAAPVWHRVVSWVQE